MTPTRIVIKDSGAFEASEAFPSGGTGLETHALAGEENHDAVQDGSDNDDGCIPAIQNNRIGDAGRDLTESLNDSRFPPVFVTDAGEVTFETPLRSHVKGSRTG